MGLEGVSREEIEEVIGNWQRAKADYPELRTRKPRKLTAAQEFDASLPTDPAGYLAAIRKTSQ